MFRRDQRAVCLAPFPPSLRLRFTFPFAEPQAEATSLRINTQATRQTFSQLA